MKALASGFLILMVCAAAYGQTEDLGMGAFANEHGAILIAVDAALLDFHMNSPYVMFVVYMASKNQNQEIVVGRDTISMDYQGQEYKMASFKELQEKYKATIRDIDFYRHLGKEGIFSSWVRIYNFPRNTDFFPPLTMQSSPAVDEGSLYGFIGFRTKAYFKNPGFKKGDKLTIRVWDKKNPNLKGECSVVLN